MLYRAVIAGLVFWGLGGMVFAQTFVKDVRPIVIKRCGACHYDGGMAPFPLLSYEDFSRKAQTALAAIESGLMPPWPADTAYRRYVNQNVLTEKEKQVIRSWIEAGKPRGKGKEKPVPPPKKWRPDYVVQMQDSFTLLKHDKDRYLFFHIPQKAEMDMNVSVFAYRPGFPQTHHTELFADSTARQSFDFTKPGFVLNEGNESYETKYDYLASYYYLSGWLPGNRYILPKNFAMRIPKGTQFLLLEHYAPTSKDYKFKSEVALKFTRGKPKRFVTELTMHGHSDLVVAEHHAYERLELNDENRMTFFKIEAGTAPTLHAQKTLDKDWSCFGFAPHAHHLARKIVVYAVRPQGDTVPLVKIDDWRAEWQWMYLTDKFLYLPKGTTVHMFFTYDNTENNPENPYFPPRDVVYSFNADQEMMEFFLFCVPYKRGDEHRKVKYPRSAGYLFE
jgi:hypothetical protein